MTKVELRQKGVVLDDHTPPDIIEKYIKEFPELKKLKNAKDSKTKKENTPK